MLRVVVSAAGAVLVGVILLFTLHGSRGGIALDMDGDPPGFVTGLYPSERDGTTTFAWTSARVVIRLAGLDRRIDWTCTMQVRGARDASLPMPSLTLTHDAAASRTVALDNTYQPITIDIPARPDRPGLTLTADVSPTFVPGPGDRRELGAQVDWIRCDPSGRARPTMAAIRSVALVTGLVGLALATAGVPLLVTLATTGLVAAGIALLLSNGNGEFGPYPWLLTRIGAGGAVLILAGALTSIAVRRRRLTGPALAALVAASILGALKLAALVHPAKPLVDAVFQAHRLQSVLAGHYFFTQPLPDGVQFPYAIGLYVAALPFAGLLSDHVLLLRIVVIAAEALAGGLLYLVLARGFQAPWAGVAAVVLFQFVPLPYIVIGNANLTNAFAQAVALMAIVVVANVPESLQSRRALVMGVGAMLLTSLAFLSHVSTIVLLAAMLGGIALALFAGDRRHRPLALAIGGIVLAAGIVSVALYYRHFTEVYERAFERVRAPAEVTAIDTRPAGPSADAPAVLVRPLAWHERAADSVRQTTAQIGWPMLVLMPVGVLSAVVRPRARGTLLLAGWVMAWLACLLGGTMTRVDTQYQRYAAEFIGRVNLAAYPAAVLLAALGLDRLWRWGTAGRLAATLIGGAAAIVGMSAWLGWFS